MKGMGYFVFLVIIRFIIKNNSSLSLFSIVLLNFFRNLVGFGMIVCIFFCREYLGLEKYSWFSQLAVKLRFKLGLFYFSVFGFLFDFELILKLNVSNIIGILV